MTKKNKAMTIADQTLQQIGGRKFVAMTGAACFSDGANQETLVVKFKGSRVANIMYLTLNGSDLYDMRICKYSGTRVVDIYNSSEVFVSDIIPIFEDITKLKTSL